MTVTTPLSAIIPACDNCRDSQIGIRAGVPSTGNASPQRRQYSRPALICVPQDGQTINPDTYLTSRHDKIRTRA